MTEIPRLKSNDTSPASLKTFMELADILPKLWGNPSLLKKLSKKQEFVIYRRFLSEDRIVTQQEIADEMGVTYQDVQHLQNNGMRILKRPSFYGYKRPK